MSKQSYEKAKFETLTKLGLAREYFEDDEFELALAETNNQRPNRMGDETAYMFNETAYNIDKTDFTHHTTKTTTNNVKQEEVVVLDDDSP